MSESDFDKNGLDKSGTHWLQYAALAFSAFAVYTTWAYYNDASFHSFVVKIFKFLNCNGYNPISYCVMRWRTVYQKWFYENLSQNFFQIIPIFILGLSRCYLYLARNNIWKQQKCFFKILLDGSDGSIRVGNLLSINSNYLLKIKNTKNKYLKILFIGDSFLGNFK